MSTNLLEKHKVQISDLNLPISWSDEFFIPFDWGHFSFVYNSESLKEPPKSFDELASEENSLKIIIQDPRTSTPGLGLLTWMKILYGNEAENKWSKLNKKIKTV